MVEPQKEIEEADLSVAQKIKILEIEKKHIQTKKDLVLELTSRDDVIDKTLEQYEGAKKKLVEVVEGRHRIGDIELKPALNSLLDRISMLDWLNSQKEQVYLKFIEKICGKVEE